MHKKGDKMKEDINLILATRDDAELIHKMKYEAFLPLYERYHDDETSPAKEDVEKVIRQLQEDTTDYYLINYQGNNVGAVRIRKKPDQMIYISPLFILPEYQNKGIGFVVIQLLFSKYSQAVTWRLDIFYRKRVIAIYTRSVDSFEEGKKK